MLKLSKKDIEYIASQDFEIQTIEEQIRKFGTGFPYSRVKEAATKSKGVLSLSSEEKKRYATLYEDKLQSRDFTVTKFVPASGASTRMFKDLFAYLDKPFESLQIDTFFSKIEKFAFYPHLKQAYAKAFARNFDVSDRKGILEVLLTERGLNYGSTPKALIFFHNFEQEAYLAIEEHIIEGLAYANCQNKVRIALTISPNHEQSFKKALNTLVPKYKQNHGVDVQVKLSYQGRKQDIIAVNMDNTPFRDEKGNLLFRPGGHGALLSNLNRTEGDIIFIKNIDNVSQRQHQHISHEHKKVLAGVLLEKEQAIYQYIDALKRSGEHENLLYKVEQFLRSLGTVFGGAYDKQSSTSKVKILLQRLQRPLRVCGMVKNTGEPGGGPFWVEEEGNNLSLQILEANQIAPENRDILQKAEYFNPVDVVLTRNTMSKQHDYFDYMDGSAGFISTKTYKGQEIKVQEWPGLWNGSMADWNTVFVDVPIETFNPVKTVFDLLKPMHQ